MEIAEKRAVDTDVHQELPSGNWVVLATDTYETPDPVWTGS